MEFLPLDHVPPNPRTGKWTSLASYTSILLGTLILGLQGVGRSLWLDEAWVANSIHESTLLGMFYYPGWLQSTPPLFLLVARSVIGLAGLSSLALRAIPLIFQLLAAAGMLAVARRVVAAPVALLATALLVFHPLPVEYFRSFKQYGAEMAATTILLLATVRYLQSPGRREYLWLLGATTLLLPLSYPLAFLLPGVVLAVWFTDRIRSAVLAGASAVMLGLLYVVFIRPNVDSRLLTFWRDDPDLQYGGGPVVIAIFAAVAAYAAWRKREWTMAICLLPCVLLLLAEVSGWYPASPRTRLFVRPCFLLALAMVADDLYRRVGGRWRQVHVAVTLAAVVVMGWGLRKQFVDGSGRPFEDYESAVSYLRENVGPDDVLLVHPSAREGFRLYTEIEKWHPAAVYGDTGWPCCPREHAAARGSSNEAAVRQDFYAKIPKNTAGRIWLFYTGRTAHWEYTGLHEGELWQRLLAERACTPGDPKYVVNLVIQNWQCPAQNFP